MFDDLSFKPFIFELLNIGFDMTCCFFKKSISSPFWVIVFWSVGNFNEQRQFVNKLIIEELVEEAFALFSVNYRITGDVCMLFLDIYILN